MQVWGANADNWNLALGSSIPGSGQAADMGEGAAPGRLRHCDDAGSWPTGVGLLQLKLYCTFGMCRQWARFWQLRWHDWYRDCAVLCEYCTVDYVVYVRGSTCVIQHCHVALYCVSTADCVGSSFVCSRTYCTLYCLLN